MKTKTRDMFDIVGIDTPCIDLNISIDQYPGRDASTGIKQLSWQGGGKVSTGLAACARLSAKCAIMGCVGNDVFGRFIINDFKRHGIDTRGLKVTDTSPLSVVLSERTAACRTILYKSGAGLHFTPEDININMLQAAKYLFICRADAASSQAADIARSAGAKVFIDADWYTEQIIDMLPKIDIFVGSEFFFNGMFAESGLSIRAAKETFASFVATNKVFEANCRKIMSMGPQIVLFTFGERGCIGVCENGFFHIPAFKVDVVDTVGAGDVFHGAFVTGLLQGRSTKDAAIFASAAAAIKCTRIGGRAGIPCSKTVERFLQDGFIDYTEIDKRAAYYERGLDHENP